MPTRPKHKKINKKKIKRKLLKEKRDKYPQKHTQTQNKI